MTIRVRWANLLDNPSEADRSPEGGYVAVMTALLLFVFMGLAAFAVDVGNWYVVGQQEQRAADAAALAGVTKLPEDLNSNTGAIKTAGVFSKTNGFTDGLNHTTVTAGLDGRPTRLRVTVTRTVANIFGPLLGVPNTTISRTAVADYAGPVPLGSPCNEYGDDPDPAGHRSSNCAGAAQFWANVGSPLAPKGNGDAYQNDMATNTDYDPNGYFYTVTVRQAGITLNIEAFDPALIDVGDTCGSNGLSNAKNLTTSQAVVNDPGTRYKDGTNPATYCTGDVKYGGTGDVQTQFTVRSPGLNPWNPLSYPAIGGTCTQIFNGYSGDMNKVLDKTPTAEYTARPDVAANFRQWKTLCTIPNAAIGTYMIQVKTNGVGNDLASGHNRFSLRAYGATSAENDSISVAGYDKMAMYANTPSGITTFFLARVPSGAKGQLFNVSLWDVGDGAGPNSTITVLPPAETNPPTFSNCQGAGVQVGPLTGCKINVSSSFNAQWQTISVPIPASYACTDLNADNTLSTTGCWVRLKFDYGSGSNPMDTTSWTASIEGDPVRLVQ
jgi:Putative Flp pilus-assembly TadE/G-like